MRVYGIELSEKRTECEFCGFMCFDEEFRCQNCDNFRTSSLTEDTIKTTDNPSPGKHYSLWLLEAASKRGKILNWIFPILCLICHLISVRLLHSFITHHDLHFGFLLWTTYPKDQILLFLILMLLSGIPGFQCTRISEEKLREYKFSRGFFRLLKDGRFSEFIYSIVIFLIMGVLICLLMPAELTHLYYSFRITQVSESLYIFLGIIGMQAINFLWFLWHILGNIFCPYDYKSELKLRLNIYKKQR